MILIIIILSAIVIYQNQETVNSLKKLLIKYFKHLKSLSLKELLLELVLIIYVIYIMFELYEELQLPSEDFVPVV